MQRQHTSSATSQRAGIIRGAATNTRRTPNIFYESLCLNFARMINQAWHACRWLTARNLLYFHPNWVAKERKELSLSTTAALLLLLIHKRRRRKRWWRRWRPNNHQDHWNCCQQHVSLWLHVVETLRKGCPFILIYLYVQAEYVHVMNVVYYAYMWVPMSISMYTCSTYVHIVMYI